MAHLTSLLCLAKQFNSKGGFQMIKIERIYDYPIGSDSFRILVDRFWPRGLSKDKVKVDLWQKDIAPSNSLRVWFGHDEKKWDGFRRRYFNELDKHRIR